MSDLERWRISKHPERNNAIFGPDTQGLVPVVPCDDAAVERAKAALRTWYPSYFVGRPHKELEVAERVIRALAGEETP